MTADVDAPEFELLMVVFTFLQAPYLYKSHLCSTNVIRVFGLSSTGSLCVIPPIADVELLEVESLRINYTIQE